MDTVYFGGGTPTVLGVDELSRLLERCAVNYSFADNTEITFEANPATVDVEGLSVLRASGFNRISLGLQSTRENELRALGRIHSYADFCHTYGAARSAGFDNISADLMYGIPEQTEESLAESLRALCELRPEHISAYCLKVEENTPFGRLGDALVLPDEDTQYRMYMLVGDILRGAGYEKYEISNFSLLGRESRHNMRYWLGNDYLGFGAAAHSYFGGERFATEPNIVSFARGEFAESERERITGEERMLEYVMLRMRTVRGIPFSEFSSLFGEELTSRFPMLLHYRDSGYISLDGGCCRFTDRGFFVSNYILSEMLDFA